jgi:glucose-6-phosphate 1-dehydrogenase
MRSQLERAMRFGFGGYVDYVEEAWRIVDPVLKEGTPVFEYEPQTWGPEEVERITPPGGWLDPVAKG